MSKLYVLFAALILVAGSLIVNAVTPDDEANQVSLGSAALGVTLTTAGDLVPNVTGAVDLGNTTYKFGALNMSGNAAIGGTLVVTGATTLTGGITTPLSSVTITSGKATYADTLTGSKGMVTSTMTITGVASIASLVYPTAITVASTAPTFVGQLGYTSAYVVYIATALPVGSWVKVGAQ